jgi:glycolate oxidase
MHGTRQDKVALKALIEVLGNECVFTDEASCFAASFDNLKISFLPSALIRPRDEQDIEQLLTLANRYRVPVTVRGGGTATTGSAAPVCGGWVMDLSHWTACTVDKAAGLAYVQPGVKTEALIRAANAAGWFYPPDPSSIKYSTIGGNIACNAGGMHGAKYGVTRDYVLALEGFLPTGEWVRWAGDVKKFSAGYNMRDLWVGSEGTLGIITGAVIKLVPKPPSKSTFLAAFKDEKTALKVVKTLLGRRVIPSVLEFMDRQTIECTLKKGFKIPLPLSVDKPSAILLFELDGHKSRVAEEKKILLSILSARAESYRQARGKQMVESLWNVRRKCSQSMFMMGDSKLNEDVVVPLESQIPLIEFTLKLKAESGLATPTFGHAADGNFHVHVMFDRENPVHREKAEVAVMRIMEKVIELGGSISGEHGIGLAKTPFLSLQHSPAEINAMRSIKNALDPNGILNPGKFFEPFRVWEHKAVRVKMPWDH